MNGEMDMGALTLPSHARDQSDTVKLSFVELTIKGLLISDRSPGLIKSSHALQSCVVTTTEELSGFTALPFYNFCMK